MNYLLMAVIIVVAAIVGGGRLDFLTYTPALIVFGMYAFVAGGLFQVLRVFGFKTFSGMVIVISAIWFYLIGTGFQYTMHDQELVTKHADAEVTLTLKGGNVILTNLSDAYMHEGRIACTIAYENGQRIDREFFGGFGGHMIDRGDSTEFAVVQRSTFREFRSTPESMECRVDYVSFYQKPEVNVGITWELNTLDYLTDFQITNNSTVAIKNVQISCKDNKGFSKRIDSTPAFKLDLREETVIKPGETVQFRGNERTITYSHCSVSNAVKA